MRHARLIACCGVLMLSILGLTLAFMLSMARARHDFDRAAVSEEQLATVARIEAALNGDDREALSVLLQRYRQSIAREYALLGGPGERPAEAVEAARADRLIALVSQPASDKRNQAIRELVATISDGERVEAELVASRMARSRRHTTLLAVLLTLTALASTLLGSLGLLLANRRLSREVAARTDALATIERSRRLFFAKVSHELRTPITVMRGEAEVALSDASKRVEPLREALDRVVANSEFLEHRVEELLSLAHAENGELVLQEAVADLGEIVQAAVQAASGYARSLEIGVEIERPDRQVPVFGDARWLQQALVAILDNAIKFSPPTGTVSLALALDAHSVTIAVRDQGTGIAVGDVPRIFDAYYQAETGRQRGGTGLGLALARWVVERHAGSIHASNEQGGGCTMTIRLPLAA